MLGIVFLGGVGFGIVIQDIVQNKWLNIGDKK